MRSAHKILRVGCVAAFVSLLCGQTSSPSVSVAAPEMPAQQLVRIAIDNELAASGEDGVKHIFRSRKQTPKGSQTKLYVETSEAMAGMLIAINDQPLTAERQQGEVEHLGWLMENPDQLRKKHAREKEDAERTLRIIKALPDAFRYQYATDSNDAPGLTRLKFTPNSDYEPPSRVEQVLEGMDGYLLINTASKRLERIDGTLFKDVSFGWGIIGRLDKGGTFGVHQENIGNGDWEITEIKLKITGKILLFKGISMISDEVFSDFRAVPKGTTFVQAVEMLKAQQKQQNAGSTSSDKTRPR